MMDTHHPITAHAFDVLSRVSPAGLVINLDIPRLHILGSFMVIGAGQCGARLNCALGIEFGDAPAL